MNAEIEVISAADDLEIGVTAAEQGPEIEATSAANGPEIKVTSAAEDPEIKVASAAEDPDVEDDEEDARRSQWPKNSIFRAPTHMRYARGSDFEPKLVSIGPYYHGRENLKPMEELKLRCMSDLLKMQQVGESSIHRSISDSDLEKQPVDVSININDVSVEFMYLTSHARLSYKEKFDQNDGIFVRMLVLDSCFIIRIMLSLCQEVQESMIFLGLNIKEVRSDLLLLENQIPLKFIERVYHWLVPRSDHPKFPPFINVVELFIWVDMPWRFNHGMSYEAAHLLDVYWKCSSSPMINEELNNCRKHPPSRRKEKPSWAETHFLVTAPKVIGNATLLHQMAGINFEKLNDQGHEGLNVIFSKGIMWMPCLKMDSSQTTLFLNLIAFENSIPHHVRTFSSYIKLMDDLIDSEKDVELLQQSGVIYNTLSSHKMAATVFNDIGNYCMIDYDMQLLLYGGVKEHYDSSWNRSWASLRNNYCNSPWARMSVCAGVTLLILTEIQTFYTMYGYYYPRH